MPQDPSIEAKKCHSRDDLDLSVIVTGSQHQTPSTCLVAALETATQVKGEKKNSGKHVEVKMKAQYNMSSKDLVTAATTVSKSTQGMVTEKQRAAHTVKNQGTKSLAAQVKMQVPDKLSMVPEVEESEVDINSYGSKNVSDNSLDIYVPHGPDDTDVNTITAIYAGADNDDHSDDDEYAEEDAKNAELEDDYEEEDEDNDEEDLPPQSSKSQSKSVTAISATAPLHPKELIFLIPVCDQWEQEATICHACKDADGQTSSSGGENCKDQLAQGFTPEYTGLGTN
ncbi:hypothetical protein K439DRAFT_1624671 [Ramaria rubella]|nr:hypothetical protein K439DRAFT_1624671 [Ramaria rubella]